MRGFVVGERPVEATVTGPADPVALEPGGHDPRAVLRQVRALVLLAGTVRPSELALAADRSMLDLPIRQDRTLLQAWAEQARAFGELVGLDSCPLRVRINSGGPAPTLTPTPGVEITVETDEAAYRGTGGVLRDIAVRLDDHDYLLVAHGAQVALEPLPRLALELASTGAPASLVSHDDGTPGGMMLIRCDLLKTLPPVGFIDLKEQALPRLAREHEVRVVRRARASDLPVRTLSNYIFALRALHLQDEHPGEAANPFAEDWRSSFAVIEPGAKVAGTARIHDSVVLAGSEVADHAVVVRAVLGPGARVPANTAIVDRVLGGSANGKGAS